MKKPIKTLKSFFEQGDSPKQEEFSDLIDSFIHKDDGVSIVDFTKNINGDILFTFTNGEQLVIEKYHLPIEMPISFITELQTILSSKVNTIEGKQLSTEDFTSVFKTKLEELQNYTHPATHNIAEVNELQNILNDKVSLTTNEEITGKKRFSEIVELLNGLKISNFSGTGLRNLVVQADGTVDVQAIAVDVFVNDVLYNESTKQLTLSFVNGTDIDIDLSGLEEDLTGLQASIIALQNEKLNHGGYTGTAQDLNNNKRDKTSYAKSITDNGGNLELVGDVTAPISTYYYGTNKAGAKGYHRISPNFFSRENHYLGGSTNNLANQEFFIDLNSFEILKPGDQLELNNFQFRGDFSETFENVLVSFDTIDTTVNKTNSVLIGDFTSYDDAIWHSANGVGDKKTVTLIMMKGKVGFKIYVSPSININFIAPGMTNWWELRANLQFKTI
jgi:hypothetical protein